MRFTFKDGGMHLMFIRDIEAEVEMLEGEGYVEVKDWPRTSRHPYREKEKDGRGLRLVLAPQGIDYY